MSIEKDIREAVTKYSDMLYKICIVILCNEQDVQDAIQDTFCRYLEKRPSFRDEEHEKAWLIRVATNICRDMIRFRIRHPKISIDELEHSLAAPEQRETLRELLELPVKQKTVIPNLFRNLATYGCLRVSINENSLEMFQDAETSSA